MKKNKSPREFFSESHNDFFKIKINYQRSKLKNKNKISKSLIQSIKIQYLFLVKNQKLNSQFNKKTYFITKTKNNSEKLKFYFSRTN